MSTANGTVLVTGGAGYIGSHTVRALRQAGRDVVVLDSLELGRREAIIDAPLVVGDIADRDLVTATCNEHGVTQLVHFAAYKAVGESMASPAKYWRNNINGTVELIEACLASGVNDVVFSSSCSVNGTPAVVPVTEDAPIHPESVYAETKAMVEQRECQSLRQRRDPWSRQRVRPDGLVVPQEREPERIVMTRTRRKQQVSEVLGAVHVAVAQAHQPTHREQRRRFQRRRGLVSINDGQLDLLCVDLLQPGLRIEPPSDESPAAVLADLGDRRDDRRLRDQLTRSGLSRATDGHRQ